MTGVEEVPGTAEGAGAATPVGVPHLLQNLIPGSTDAPQELQNAINHLVEVECSA